MQTSLPSAADRQVVEQVFQAMPRVPKVIVRRLVHFPLVRRDQQQRTRRRERARQFPHHGRGLGPRVPERERRLFSGERLL